MSIYAKLLEMQKRVDSIIKDARNTSDKYDFASDENVLDRFRPMMDEFGLLLIPKVERAELHEGITKSGTTRYMTELWQTMVWRDVETEEELHVPWYSQGVDLAGEKGVGKAFTYAEKYFLLKFFHVPTKKDDPDSDARTARGEKRQRGTAAARESADYMRRSVQQMLSELCKGDEEKIRASYIHYTKSDARGYPGVDNIGAVGDSVLPIIYGKIKAKYQERTGTRFVLKDDGNGRACGDGVDTP